MGSLEPARASVFRSCYIIHLPVEILLSILRVDDDATEPERLEALATVCHQWRRTILSYGPLWSKISVHSRVTRGQLSTQLARSANASLSVDLGYNYQGAPPSNDETELPRMVLLERRRVREFTLSTCARAIDTPWALDVVQALESGTHWPILYSLNIHGNISDPPKLHLDPVAPNLRHLTIGSINVQDWSCLRMWASSLQSLEVFRCNFDDVFFHELLQFAVLTKLCLPFLSDDDFAVMFRNHGSLPSLRSLTFGVGYISISTFQTLLTRTPELTFLYASLSGLRYPDFASSVNVTLPHLEALKLTVRYDCHDDILGHIFRNGRPHRLASVQLEHITLCRFDIIAGPALLRLTLLNCTVDVDEIAAALQRCPNLESLTLVCVLSGETTTSIPEAGILARLRTADVFFHIDGLSGQAAQSTFDPAQIQRFLPFVIALLPPTCSSNICGLFSPNRVLSIRLQKSQMLSFIPHDDATWHSVKLRISTLSPDYCDVSIHSVEGNVCRSFQADSISECISLMHSHFRIFSRVSSLSVGSETAIQLFSLQKIAFSTLETLVIKFIYPSRSRPDHKPRSVDSLRAVIASAAVVPMESPLLRVIRLESLQAELLPIVLKGDLLRMFRSEKLVEVELPRNSTWTEE